MSEALPPEPIQRLIDREEKILEGVLASLRQQEIDLSHRLRSEQDRARELTESLVSFKRDEDKQMIASDEAVSHALKDRYDLELEAMAKLIKSPYFARIVIDEFDEKTNSFKEVEYKIGAIANAQCRIIDWKKSPLAKLYYEYREGDDFSEEIQGKPRDGTIKERISIDIDNSILVRLGGSFGEAFKTKDGWSTQAPEGMRKRPQGRQSLPDVAQLITQDQFKAITQDAKTAVLIQGVAGSGKTTVALYRLAWLVANKHIEEKGCKIIVHSPALRSYITHSLPTLGVNNIECVTWDAFSESLLKLIPGWFHTVQTAPIPATIARVKRSVALLKRVEELSLDPNLKIDELIPFALKDARGIIERDETKLLNQESITDALNQSNALLRDNHIDKTDIPLILRAAQIRKLPLQKFTHLVIDEAQDYSPAELAVVVAAVKESADLTIVGDTAQDVKGSGFPGWEKLQKFLPQDATQYIPLKVSHRSTLPIMRLADHIQQRSSVKEGRAGRVPIWFHCTNEELAVESLMTWLKKAVDKYPQEVTAVLCKSSRDAKVITSLLEPTFGFQVRQASLTDFSFEAGIVVTEIETVKGLEFCSVVLWNPSHKSYPFQGEDGQMNRNKLYVAVTRAEENVCIITHERPSAILPNHNSQLVRGIKIEPEPEETPEKKHPLELD